MRSRLIVLQLPDEKINGCARHGSAIKELPSDKRAPSSRLIGRRFLARRSKGALAIKDLRAAQGFEQSSGRAPAEGDRPAAPTRAQFRIRSGPTRLLGRASGGDGRGRHGGTGRRGLAPSAARPARANFSSSALPRDEIRQGHARFLCRGDGPTELQAEPPRGSRHPTRRAPLRLAASAEAPAPPCPTTLAELAARRPAAPQRSRGEGRASPDSGRGGREPGKIAADGIRGEWGWEGRCCDRSCLCGHIDRSIAKLP